MTGDERGGRGLARYMELVRLRPELFANPPHGGFRILLTRDEIAAAEAEAAARLDERGLPREWSRVGIAFEDEYFLLLRDAVTFPDGRRGTYIRAVGHGGGPAGVAILPVHESKVLLVRHFRHATRSPHLEIPRGFWVEGLTGPAVARKELEEELAIAECRLTSLGRIHSDTGLTSHMVELFAATVATPGRANLAEAIEEVVPVGVAELERLIRDDEITDSFTVAAYARAKLHGIL
ncbi:MAG: NUDIX hydrolase [Actinomycetota bacterium]|nr:NUDIX hydrolase [Actinomycetota bacterium]